VVWMVVELGLRVGLGSRVGLGFVVNKILMISS
jgi:hypothetical protein